MNFRKSWYIVLILLLAGIFVVPAINLPYKIRSRAIIYPAKEWSLVKAQDGQLAYLLMDHFNNSVSEFAFTEFQRGDHSHFTLNMSLFENERVNSGDLIAHIISSEEQRRLIELKGELEVREKLLEVYLTGERQQDVVIAHERMLLARKEFENQQKLMDRSQKLFDENVIASQEYDISLNEFEVKQLAYQIARSQHQAALTGSKPEQLNLVRAEIRALQSQIHQLEQRIDAFTIRSPFSGTIIRSREQALDNQVFIRISCDSVKIAVLPVELYQLQYIHNGQKVYLQAFSGSKPIPATIESIGNSVQLINRRQSVFITAVLDNPHSAILPGMIIEAEIHGGKISLGEYISRLTRMIYAN
jgi:multidrug efflux pump subunit AcrA (membrane-fusion protein)